MASQAELDALDTLIATGVLSLERRGLVLRYRSVDELIQTREYLAGRIPHEVQPGSKGGGDDGITG